MTLILASTSPIRRAMLEAAGVAAEAFAPGVDEQRLKSGSAADAALRLAEAKAEAVSSNRPDAWVIGSDSIVSLDGGMLDKPADRAQAAEHLRAFSGREI